MHRVIIVAGLGFGDEGKGTVVESLVDRYRANLVVRYNGGCQAEHNVVLPDGRHHTFSQFGSGTLLGARTFLSRFMLVDPFALMMEADHLTRLGADPLGLLAIDRDAPVITFYHRAANRLREASRGNGAHGSCGRGIGECRVESMTNPDFLRVGDLADVRLTEAKLAAGRARIVGEFGEGDYPDPKRAAESLYLLSRSWKVVDGAWLHERMLEGTTVFEGAQGVLLDQDHGFQPHTTWSDTTFGWADDLIPDDIDPDEILRVGVTRAYQTRHGAGPLPTERPMGLAESHNAGGFAGSFRTGLLDLPLLRYASTVCGGLDRIAVTHMDRRPGWDVCTNWGQSVGEFIQGGHPVPAIDPTYERQCGLTRDLLSLDPDRFVIEPMTGDELVERIRWETMARILVRSYGPTRADKVWA